MEYMKILMEIDKILTVLGNMCARKRMPLKGLLNIISTNVDTLS